MLLPCSTIWRTQHLKGNTMNIQKYLDLFEYQKDEESTNPRFKEGFWSFKTNVIDHENQDYVKLSEVMRDSDLDEDSRYTFTVEALEAMKEILDSDTESIEDMLEDPENVNQYSEAPIYNSELLEWMSKRTNYTFVDEYIKEYGFNEGIIEAIRGAYSMAWEEHYFKVLEAVKE